MRLFSVVAVTLVFAWLLAGAVDQTFAGEPVAIVSPDGVSSAATAKGAELSELASPAEFTGSSTRAASIRAIRLVFGARAPAAIRVASCETGGTFYARSVNWRDHHSDGSWGSFGLFGIGALHRSAGESVAHFARRMWDPIANSRMAYRLSRGGTSWRPWTCQP